MLLCFIEESHVLALISDPHNNSCRDSELKLLDVRTHREKDLTKQYHSREQQNWLSEPQKFVVNEQAGSEAQDDVRVRIKGVQQVILDVTHPIRR